MSTHVTAHQSLADCATYIACTASLEAIHHGAVPLMDCVKTHCQIESALHGTAFTYLYFIYFPAMFIGIPQGKFQQSTRI